MVKPSIHAQLKVNDAEVVAGDSSPIAANVSKEIVCVKSISCNSDGSLLNNDRQTSLSPQHCAQSPVHTTAHGHFIRYYRSSSESLMKSRSENNVYHNVQRLSPDVDAIYQRESTSNETLYQLRDWKGMISPRTVRKSSAHTANARKKGEKLTLSHNCLLTASYSPVVSPKAKQKNIMKTTDLAKSISNDDVRSEIEALCITGKCTARKPNHLKLPSLN